MINKIPQVDLVFDRRKVSSATRKGMVEIRITYEKKQKYISTGMALLQNQWRKHRVANLPDALERNQILDKLMKDVWGIILEMVHEGEVDIFKVPERLERVNKARMIFLDYCRQRAEVRKYGKSRDNQQRYDRFLNFLNRWGRIRDFADVTEANIILLDSHLGRMKNNSKWYNYHRFLNSFILDAIGDGYLHSNPYRNLSIGKGDSEGLEKHLTPEEFERLRDVKLPTESLERVRDLFIFQTYTCLSYADLADFDASRIQDVDGMKVYVGSRQKTKGRFTIPLLSPALEILEKYNGKLPIISNVKYNLYLKAVAQMAGIDKKVSTHWARHTGATLLLNAGVDMQIVSKICGHSSIRMTERIYAKLLDETVVKAVRRIAPPSSQTGEHELKK